MVTIFLRFVTIISAFLLISFLLISPAAADGPAFIHVGGGYYDVNNNNHASELHLEYLPNSKWGAFSPFAGVMTTSDSAFYSYGGIRLDLDFGDHWVITPAFAPGLYHDGDGKDLGHLIEFRTALDVAYKMEGLSRVGMSFYHLSNAGLGDTDPGIEAVTFNYSYPLDE